MMPEMDGIEFINEVRKNPKLSFIPIIVLTAKYNTEEDIAKLFEMGVNDYISKPFYNAELIARLRTHAKLKIATEELLRANEELKYSATHDELTTVLNRTAIFNFLENEMHRVKRFKKSLCLLMFDIDYFKKINDTYGHLVGDFVLRTVTTIIKKNIREVDLLGRYGGDEFLIILPETNIDKAEEIAQRIHKSIETHSFKTNKLNLKLTLSIGLAAYKKDYTVDKFIETVDTALYEAKNAGRNCLRISDN